MKPQTLANAFSGTNPAFLARNRPTLSVVRACPSFSGTNRAKKIDSKRFKTWAIGTMRRNSLFNLRQARNPFQAHRFVPILLLAFALTNVSTHAGMTISQTAKADTNH